MNGEVLVDRVSTAEEILSEDLTRLDRIELEWVRCAVAGAETLGLRPLAAFATRLGNGWLYLFAALLLIPARTDAALRTALVSIVSMASAFLIYPALKHMVRRCRPYEKCTALRSTVRALDRYSFPSGHAMTAAACGVPFLFTYSLAAALVVVPIWTLISWSRLALGHHYLSDVAAGTVLGVMVACAVALAFS